MEIAWNVVAIIAAPLIALFVGAVLNRAIESRPRLVTYLGHVSAHRLKREDNTPYDIFTHSVVLRNSGRRPRLRQFPSPAPWAAQRPQPQDRRPGGRAVEARRLGL